MSLFLPSKKILEEYANVFVNFALNNGNGIKKHDVVFLEVPECAKLLLVELQKAVLKAGGHYITQFIPDETALNFYELAEEHHLDFFPAKYLKGKIDQADHAVYIISETNKKELESINPAKIMRRSKAQKQYQEWKEQKENEGKFTWTLGLFATPAMANEAKLSVEEYWSQIIKACYLNYPDPVGKWKKTFAEIIRIQDELNKLPIEKVQIKSENTDLIIGVGKNRKWLGGSGRNIPSFEIFISPDWRYTSGYIGFDLPLYRYGNLIENVYLEFQNGVITKATASKGEHVLKEMIAVKNADKIGEFSLTDVRLSHIDKFMAETLFDENFGGQYGNTHIALGNAYKDSFTNDPSKLSEKEWESLGFNNSVVHTDIISTKNRIVTAFLEGGTKKVIYEKGQFTI